MAKITKEAALLYHSQGKPGKIEVVPTKPYSTQTDLSLAYSPGVAEPCLEIEKNPQDAYKYTAKGNLVAVISNGTAVLGHAYYNEGKLSSAEYCFEQALRYDPNYGYSYYSLATIYTLRGEDERALETLKKLVTIQENHPLVYAELATWYAMHDDEKNAEEAYDKAILCGYKDPEELSKRMTALRMFNHAENATGNDLPRDYYRYIEKEETEETVKEDTDAGNV